MRSSNGKGVSLTASLHPQQKLNCLPDYAGSGPSEAETVDPDHLPAAPRAHDASSGIPRLTLACRGRAAVHDFSQTEGAAHGRTP